MVACPQPHPAHHQILGDRQGERRQVEHLHAGGDRSRRAGQVRHRSRRSTTARPAPGGRGWPPGPGRCRDAPAAHPACAGAGPAHPRPAARRVTAGPAGRPAACPPSPSPSRPARPCSAAARSSRSPGPPAAAAPPTRPATPRSTPPARPAGRPARPPEPPTPHTRASLAARTRRESNMIKHRTPAPTRRRSAGGLTGYRRWARPRALARGSTATQSTSIKAITANRRNYLHCPGQPPDNPRAPWPLGRSASSADLSSHLGCRRERLTPRRGSRRSLCGRGAG